MGLSTTLKSSFVAGLILLTPLLVTLYILRFLVNWLLQFINPIVAQTRLTTYTGIEIVAQFVAVVLIVAIIVVLGYLARQRTGQFVFGHVGRIIYLIPLVNTIYASIRQVATALVERETTYESVVLVEWPNKQHYSIGFVTGEPPEEITDFVGEATYSVYLPNTPNPTAGRLVILPESQIYEIDISVRYGMRLVVTGGIAKDQAEAELSKLKAADSSETGEAS